MDWNPTDTLPDAFFDVARTVYAGDPGWIPEQAKEARALFSPAHSFFETGSAWLDVIPGKARLAGFVHPDARVGDEPAAYFGYWETLDDAEACATLFRRFEAWARSKGVRQVMGPINFRTHYAYRVRLNHFDTAPFHPGEPYNPAYYLTLLDRMGYRQSQLYHSWFGDGPAIVASVNDAISRVMDRAVSHGFRFIPLTPEWWLENLESLHEDTRAIFGDNPGFSQISMQEFRALLGPEKVAAVDPNCSLVVLGPEGRMVAFMLTFPDFAPLVCQGAANPLSPYELRFADHFRLLSRPTLIAKTVGVMPKYRRLGLVEIMCYLSTKASLPDYGRVSSVLMRVGGLTATRSTKVFSVEGCFTHEYGLFTRTLD